MRELLPYDDHFWDFYNAQNAALQKKIDYVLYIVRNTKVIPGKFFKHVEDGIYEIRVQLGDNILQGLWLFRGREYDRPAAQLCEENPEVGEARDRKGSSIKEEIL